MSMRNCLGINTKHLHIFTRSLKNITISKFIFIPKFEVLTFLYSRSTPNGDPIQQKHKYVVEKEIYERPGQDNNPEIVVEKRIYEDDGKGGSKVTIKDKVFDRSQQK